MAPVGRRTCRHHASRFGRDGRIRAWGCEVILRKFGPLSRRSTLGKHHRLEARLLRKPRWTWHQGIFALIKDIVCAAFGLTSRFLARKVIFAVDVYHLRVNRILPWRREFPLKERMLLNPYLDIASPRP